MGRLFWYNMHDGIFVQVSPNRLIHVDKQFITTDNNQNYSNAKTCLQNFVLGGIHTQSVTLNINVRFQKNPPPSVNVTLWQWKFYDINQLLLQKDRI